MSEKRNLLIFAGAGASVGLGYPTTEQFMKNLDGKILNHHIYRAIPKNHLSDIEKTLWFINSEILEPIKSCLIDRPFLYKNCYTKSGGSDSVASFYTYADELTKSIKRQLHDSYKRENLRSQNIEEYWLSPFFEEWFQHAWNMEFFTTNYDLAIETCVENYNIDIYPFKRSHTDPGLDMDLWKTDKAFSRSVWLTKLHGSLNWKAGDNNNVIESTQGFSDYHTILYPGFKGKPNSSPFREFHNYFSECLKKCKCFLITGFSFRDEYINELIKKHLHPQTPVFIVDPEAPKIKASNQWEKHTLVYDVQHNCDNPTISVAKNSLYERHG